MLKSRPFEQLKQANDTTFKRNKEQVTNSKEINTVEKNEETTSICEEAEKWLLIWNEEQKRKWRTRLTLVKQES